MPDSLTMHPRFTAAWLKQSYTFVSGIKCKCMPTNVLVVALVYIVFVVLAPSSNTPDTVLNLANDCLMLIISCMVSVLVVHM